MANMKPWQRSLPKHCQWTRIAYEHCRCHPDPDIINWWTIGAAVAFLTTACAIAFAMGTV